ncbi:MAG: DUF4214 domain-containing protein [Oscillospiraceae bacterium]|nr:DUF4214 domain-containing protein [Oscillospiraceae bacterium]
MNTKTRLSKLLAIALTLAMTIALIPGGFVAPQPASAATATVLKGEVIDVYNAKYSGSLTTSVEGDTLTVSGSISPTVAIGEIDELRLEIDAGVTVNWSASITGARDSGALIDLRGAGTFNMTGGTINNTSASTTSPYPLTISCSGSVTLNISGGEVTANRPTIIEMRDTSTITVTGGTISGSINHHIMFTGGSKGILTGGTWGDTRIQLQGSSAVLRYDGISALGNYGSPGYVPGGCIAITWARPAQQAARYTDGSTTDLTRSPTSGGTTATWADSGTTINYSDGTNTGSFTGITPPPLTEVTVGGAYTGDLTHKVQGTVTVPLTGIAYLPASPTVSVDIGENTGITATGAVSGVSGTTGTLTLTVTADEGTYEGLTVTIAGVTRDLPDLTVGKTTITGAAATLTAPAKGQTPTDEATPGDETKYAANLVTWSPTGAGHTVFQPETAYTVEVTLNVLPGYTFGENGAYTGATVNGQAAATANVSGTNGSTLVLTYAFDELGAKAISGIAATTPPELSYTHGDALDLSDMELTISYDDGTSETGVVYADLATKGVTLAIDGTTVTDGYTLSHSDHDGENLTASGGSVTNQSLGTLAVAQAVPGEINAPSASGITYGGTLVGSSLTGGTGAGAWTWSNTATMPTVTNSGYEVTFTPTDTVNTDWSGVDGWDSVSKTVRRTIAITVSPLNITGATVTSSFPTTTFVGTPLQPAPSAISAGGITMTSANYDLSNWQNNTNAGVDTASVDIVGKNNFTGTATVNFSIAKASGLTAQNITRLIPSSNTGARTANLDDYVGLNHSDYGTKSYAIEGTLTDGSGVLTGAPTLSGDRNETLNYQGAGQSSGSATQNIRITTTNYTDVVITVTFTATPLDEQELSFPNSNDGVDKTFGDANFTHKATSNQVGATGAIAYESSDETVATVDEDTGEVTIVGVGETTITATIEADSTYAQATAGYILTVNNASQAAPTGLGRINETAPDENDGKITGVTDAMEYKLDTDTSYTSVPTSETEITDLSPGTYHVRFAAKTNYNAGADATVTIAAYSPPQAPTDSKPAPDIKPTPAPFTPASFSTNLYLNALGREPDEAGYDYWIGGLLDGSLSAAQVVYGFVFSAEMNEKNLNNEEFIEYLYMAFFGREPDAGGKAHWLAALNSHGDRVLIFHGFAGSLEFELFCKAHGFVVYNTAAVNV